MLQHWFSIRIKRESILWSKHSLKKGSVRSITFIFTTLGMRKALVNDEVQHVNHPFDPFTEDVQNTGCNTVIRRINMKQKGKQGRKRTSRAPQCLNVKYNLTRVLVFQCDDFMDSNWHWRTPSTSFLLFWCFSQVRSHWRWNPADTHTDTVSDFGTFLSSIDSRSHLGFYNQSRDASLWSPSTSWPLCLQAPALLPLPAPPQALTNTSRAV